ncbi:MAG: 23S rRNA (adenine(2503)-C(2))-methyltransferase RlmN [Lachnospiraceae bacterium]|nr:23S rRNA (adenine(2503)-C(2))-methyltransferase RlmN [Lachnospiraceae bacterium]MDY4970664.1 23S rRNA (adenine(2503)-C(2))-methyltransferase RlmN [Lachnospiraceae bacterium]
MIETYWNHLPDVRAMYPEELEALILSLGEKKFRAKQLFEWLHKKKAASFQDMTNLSAAFRSRLEQETELVTLKPVQELISQVDGTRKYLFELADGNVIESVWMEYKHGNSVCISSQAGCRMGCRFCASTLNGLERNLTASEMLEQVYRISSITGKRVDNVVIMGSGEPLDNYDNVLRFLHLITDPGAGGISRRNITLSTCGLVPEIRRLADENPGVTLALSLHAADDETRRTLMPIARKYALSEILPACDYYFEKTGRRVSYEYSLVKGVNDTAEEADKLSALLKGRNCHVNLIPVNPVKEREFETVTRAHAGQFKNMLEKNGINATIRREMGRDIQGACGQLRRSYKAHRSMQN